MTLDELRALVGSGFWVEETGTGKATVGVIMNTDAAEVMDRIIRLRRSIPRGIAVSTVGVGVYTQLRVRGLRA